MVTSLSSRLRALFALALFATSDGGAQLLDAVIFHRHPAAPEVTRINSGDDCHAERCDLGAPIAAPPPVAPPNWGFRLEPAQRRIAIVAPADAPRTLLATSPLGSRAPPHLS